MMSRNSNPNNTFADPVIDEFLEGQPRADTWRELCETLQARFKDAKAELAGVAEDEPRRAVLLRRVSELRAQVAALAQEEAVTRFVEDSVRASLTRPHSLGQGFDEDDF